MNKTGRFILNVGKGFYDILATYLLLWMLYITVVSLGLHALFSLLAQGLGYESAELLWRNVAWRAGLDGLWVRLGVYGVAQAVIFWLLRPVLAWLLGAGERMFDGVQRLHVSVGRYLPNVRAVVGALFSLMITVLLVPFVLQPTIVGFAFHERAMWERAANLMDGQATLGFADSVVGFYRKLYAEPVKPVEGIEQEALERVFVERPSPVEQEEWESGGSAGPIAPLDGSSQPLMDRWDPYIMAAAGQDPERFAMIKAFMWVESGGRQFAVSHTGCAGLMQFCGGTARRSPFQEIFGRGQIYRCQCNGPCRIDREAQRDMERGDESLLRLRSAEFPCDLTDARFNAERSIRAGARYIADLHAEFGGNIYLMYIGYNSGPGVARKVYARLGRNADATLEEIEVHLADSMLQWYGVGSYSRARSLVRTHLPKIKKAQERYRQQGRGGEIVAQR